MVGTLTSFFKKAVQGDQSATNQVVEYDTIEQATAKKFDARIQHVIKSLGYGLPGNKEHEHPNYLTDGHKSSIFRQIMKSR